MRKVLIAAQSRYIAGIDRHYTTSTISDMLFEAGVLPVTVHFPGLTIENGVSMAKAYLEELRPHGVLLQGGEDIPLSFYGAKHEEEMTSMRDYFELGLIQVALERGIPLFGICRGMQLLNVAMGGTLIPHLDEEQYSPHILLKDPMLGMIAENSELHTHTVKLTDSGILQECYGGSQIEVTSFHHQAVKELASELILEAVAEDGVIEAFSNQQKKILGVQWHPEVPKNNAVDNTALLHWVTWL